MSDLGWGAGGVADAMQLLQSMQTSQTENKQRQVEIDKSSLELENMKKLQASLGGQAFQSAMGSGDPEKQNKALTDLATTYLADGMPEQAAAVTRMATEMATTAANVTLKQAEESQKYITMAEDVFSQVTTPQQWSQAQQFMQSQLSPEAMKQPRVKALLTMPYSPDLVRVLPGYFDHLKSTAQSLADKARAAEANAQAGHYNMETKLAAAQIDETKARTAHLRKEGATDLIPAKTDITAAANDLQAMFPEAEAEPIVQGGKMTDPTATRANYKARLDSAAQRVAETAKLYETQLNMSPADARRKAIADIDGQKGLDMLKPTPGPARDTPAARPAAPAASSSADSWGEPELVK